jgi:hypothetical protein
MHLQGCSSYRRSIQPSKERTFSNSKHKISQLFLFLQVIFALLDPDRDPHSNKQGEIKDPLLPKKITGFNVLGHVVELTSVADPKPGSCIFFTPGPWIRIRDGKIQIQDPGSGMNIPSRISIFENLVSVFWVKNFFMQIRIRDLVDP